MRGRVVVGTCGSLGSMTALHRAATEARVRDAELWVVLAWQPPGGGPAARCSGGPSVLDGCRSAAVERLRETLDRAFGARPPGVTLAGLTARGTPGAVLVDAVADPGDLLVVGAGNRAPVLRALRPSVARYCLAHASCPVLVVPPGPLRADLESVRRRRRWRMPMDARELTGRP